MLFISFLWQEKGNWSDEYIKANIALIDKFDKKDILKANESLLESFGDIPNEIANVSNDVIALHENITTLIFSERNAKNIDTIVEATNGIVEYIKNNKEKEVVENVIHAPMSFTASIFVDKFNSKYQDLDETTMQLVKSILESDEEGRKSIFSDTRQDCIKLVNERLEESDLEDKEKLLSVKEKLLGMEFVTENQIEDITKLIDLKNTLNTK